MIPNNQILHNIRILDFTWVLAGPYATRLLGDFGAEVIKIQPMLSSEDDDAFARGYYNTWNRSKLGITLNLDKPEGIALAKKLAAISDAVVENFTPHVMANFGLDYANLKKINPDIIIVSMSTMGQHNPKSYYTGYAPTVHALSGITGLMAVDGKPVGPGFSFADHIAGLYASMSLLEALEYRRQTGEGQHVDLSAVDLMKDILQEKEAPKAVNNSYPCKGENQWCAITVETEEGWRGLKKAMGNPDMMEDTKYASPESRVENKTELDRSIGEWTREHTAEEAASILQQNGVAAGVVQDVQALVNDPRLKSRGFFIKRRGIPFTDASPVRMENNRAEYQRPAPVLGQDNDYVFGNLLGLSKRDIGELQKKGVI